MNKSRKGAQWLFAGGSGLIYPDFLGKSNNDRIVADAKYKPFNNIANDDYLQVLAYMYRFDAKKAYYFYPEVNSVADKVLYLNSGSSYENNVRAREDIYLIKHGLYIPNNSTSYEEFISKMKDSEADFMNELSQLSVV